MKRTTCEFAIALVFLVSSVGYAQAPEMEPDRHTPVFRVEVWGSILTDFDTRVSSYFELRSDLEKELQPRRVTSDPAEIRQAERALAKKIREARAKAKQGDVFTPAISAEFRKAVLLQINTDTLAAIMDDNPQGVSVQINGSFSDRKPLSTVPPSVLAVLPTLPDDIQYRFLGRHLILYDTRASLILDRIPYAIRCGHSKLTSHR